MERVIIDCLGTKAYAIENVLRKKITNISTQYVPNQKIDTPLDRHNLIVALKSRMAYMLEQSVPFQRENCFYGTIQRAFEFDGILWHLVAGVSLRSPSGQIIRAFSSSVPLDEDISEKKTEDRRRNIKDLIGQKFPDWDKLSVYEFLTGEEEIGWLQEPLRACMKRLSQ